MDEMNYPNDYCSNLQHPPQRQPGPVASSDGTEPGLREVGIHLGTVAGMTGLALAERVVQLEDGPGVEPPVDPGLKVELPASRSLCPHGEPLVVLTHPAIEKGPGHRRFQVAQMVEGNIDPGSQVAGATDVLVTVEDRITTRRQDVPAQPVDLTVQLERTVIPQQVQPVGPGPHVEGLAPAQGTTHAYRQSLSLAEIVDAMGQRITFTFRITPGAGDPTYSKQGKISRIALVGVEQAGIPAQPGLV